MEDAEKKPDSLVEHRPIDRRTIAIIIATVILSFIAFFLIDNRDILLAGAAPADQWDRIGSRIVEENCLEQARRVAIDEGYDPIVVLGCSCINVQSDILKTFDCNVNTADITQPRKVLVHCYKTSSACTIASDRGLETYSFQDLEEVLLK